MKKFIKAILTIVSIVCAMVYIVACCTPYISPLSFWQMTFLALAFPFVAIFLFLLTLLWLLFSRRITLVLLVVLLIGHKNLYSTFAFNFPATFNLNKKENTLRIISWNARYFDNNARHADGPTSVRRQMIKYIRKANADVLFFQDYISYEGEALFSNDRTFRDSLGFKYFYTSKDIVTQHSFGRSETGVAIFSKFPLTDTGNIKFTMHNESIAKADLVYQDKKIRLFTTHFASMGIHGTRKYLVKPEKQDSALVVTKEVSRTLKNFDQIHAMQAEQLRREISKSPYPIIVSGDFNSVPSSYVYHLVKGNLKDVFSESGTGIGRTYTSLTRTLRIDYIFIDPSFKVLQTETPHLFLSDHFPVVADVQLK